MRVASAVFAVCVFVALAVGCPGLGTPHAGAAGWPDAASTGLGPAGSAGSGIGRILEPSGQASSTVGGAPRAGGGAHVAESADAGDWHAAGSWHTYANADDARALALDTDALWAATASGGVARWSAEGVLLAQYLAPQDGLPCNDVRDVVRWRGRWWFGTCRGLAVYDPGRDRMEAVAAGLPSLSVTALAVDASDRLWVGTEPWWDPDLQLPGKQGPGGWTGGGAAVTSDGAEWHSIGLLDGLPSTNVRDIAMWRGTVWLATEPYQRWREPGIDSTGATRPGSFESAGGGLAEGLADGWRVYDSGAASELSESARCLAATPDALWVGTGGRGVVVYRGGKWKALRDCGNDKRCIRDDFVTALAIGGDGAVWVGTSRFNGRGTGAAVLDHRGTPLESEDDAWSVLDDADGMPGGLVSAILPVDGDASVWFAVADLDPRDAMRGRGLAHLLADRRTVTVHTSASAAGGAIAGNDVTALERDPLSGDLWVGTGGSGVGVRSVDGTWRTYTRASTDGGLGSDDIADIAVEPGGIVWIATRETAYDAAASTWVDGGLSRYEGGRWSRLGRSDGLPSNHLSALALDGRGKLWVGTGATDRGPKEHAYRGWGLAVVDTASARWERTFTVPTLTSNNITDLVVSGDLLWVATSYFLYVDPRPGGAQVHTGGGISVLELGSGRWTRVTGDNGLTVALRSRGLGSPQNLVDARTVFADPDGALWIGGSAWPDGAFEEGVEPDAIVDVVTTERVLTHRFAGAGAVRALSGDGHGMVWAATSGLGLRVWVGDEWLARRRGHDGLPDDRLNAVSFSGGETWLATATSGLVQLVPPAPPDEEGPPATPVPCPGPIVVRLEEHAYLPLVRRQALTFDVGPGER